MNKHINDDYFEVDKTISFNSSLLQELTEVILRSGTRKDKNFALAAALMTLNLFATREVVTPTNSSMIMYMIILASTGYGKDRFLRAPSNIMASMGQLGINVRMSISSVPALEKAFGNSKVVYNQIDEIGNLFFRLTKARASNIEFSLDYYLKSKWSIEPSDVDVTTETKDRDSCIIEYPILNIFGASTPEQLYGSLNRRALCDGFYNRFLIIKSDQAEKNRNKSNLVLTKTIIEDLAKFNVLSDYSNKKHHMLIPEFKVPWYNNDVEQRYFAFEDEIEAVQTRNSDLHKLFVRLPEMAIRMATLIAVSRDFREAKVTMNDLAFAINFVKQSGNLSAKYTQSLMSDNAFEAMRNRILAYIESSGIEGVNSRDICRRMGINKKVRDEILKDLLDMEFITSRNVERVCEKNNSKKEKTILFYSSSDNIQNMIRELANIQTEHHEYEYK